VGHILVVEPIEYLASIKTKHGDKDAVSCTVHDISAQATYDGCLWFGGFLVGALKGRIGQKVLGLMTLGDDASKGNAPYILQDLSGNEQAVAAATAYLTGRVASTLAAPAPAAPTPAPAAAAPSALDAALGNLAAAGLPVK
jgi:hypothetical protein